MLIAGLTDIHGQTSALEQLMPKIPDVDIILLAGDITNFGDEIDAAEVIDVIRQYNERILAIPGNCDQPQVVRYLKDEGISLHGKCLKVDNMNFVGLGGSLPCPGRTPNELSEQDFERLLQLCSHDIKDNSPVVLLTHHPPYGTKADLIATGRHVGSTSIRRFIDEIKPAVCICGHIHEARSEDKAGNTTVLNPGPAGRGFYALVEIETELKSAEIHSIND